jgi:hypothetical protein
MTSSAAHFVAEYAANRREPEFIAFPQASNIRLESNVLIHRGQQRLLDAATLAKPYDRHSVPFGLDTSQIMNSLFFSSSFWPHARGYSSQSVKILTR